MRCANIAQSTYLLLHGLLCLPVCPDPRRRGALLYVPALVECVVQLLSLSTCLLFPVVRELRGKEISAECVHAQCGRYRQPPVRTSTCKSLNHHGVTRSCRIVQRRLRRDERVEGVQATGCV